MLQLTPGSSELDTRLAEIDRRLREIQAGLAPDLAAAESPPPEAVSPAEAVGPAVIAAPLEGAVPAQMPGPAEAEEEMASTPGPERPAPLPGGSPRSGPLATLLARTRRRRTEADADEFTRLVQMQNGLLEAVGELVRLLGSRAGAVAAEPVPEPEPAREPEPEPAPEPGALVSAGPFTDTREVENFVLTLAALELVQDAKLVGYEGADRALIEVQLFEPSG